MDKKEIIHVLKYALKILCFLRRGVPTCLVPFPLFLSFFCPSHEKDHALAYRKQPRFLSSLPLVSLSCLLVSVAWWAWLWRKVRCGYIFNSHKRTSMGRVLPKPHKQTPGLEGSKSNASAQKRMFDGCPPFSTTPPAYTLAHSTHIAM